jgi:adenylate cyclase
MADGPQAATQHGFLAELKRRRVIRVLVLYAVVGWIVIEVASVVFPALHLPSWTITLVIVLVALGFPIALTLAWAVDIGPHGLQRTPPLVAATTPAPIISEPEPQPVAAAQREPQREPETRHTIAVLPFVNMSGDAENEYFSDGISEEILNLLTKLPQLKVSSRTSSFVFKGKEASIPMVARELGVSSVLEGSVRRAGEHVRITAQLIETDTDSHLWSETYDREMKDVFAIQDDIARSIVDALQIALSPKERRALQNAATANAGAYDFYLRGRRYFYAMTKRDFLHAIGMFERAIELDPKYAMAYAGLADAHSMLYRYAEASEHNARMAEQASQHAIELDPDSAEANASLGTALYTRGQYDEAEKRFEAAILINPNLFESYIFYGRACLAKGNFEKAARLFVRAAEVSPNDYQAPSLLAMAYRSLGRDELARQADARALQLIERHVMMNPDDARALCFGAYALVEAGQPERAVEWAELALQTRDNEPHYLYNTACVYAALGNHERAIALLERAVELGWGDRAWIENDSDLAVLHPDPRFTALLARMG